MFYIMPLKEIFTEANFCLVLWVFKFLYRDHLVGEEGSRALQELG